MRILHWSDNYRPLLGGIETLLENLVADQQARGNEVAVVTNQWPGLAAQENCRGCPVHRYPFVQSLTENRVEPIAANVRRLQEFKRGFRPDIIHIHSLGPSAWFHFLAQGPRRVPTLVSLHATFGELVLSERILARILHDADRIAAVSPATLREYCAAYPELQEKSEVIFNGLPWPEETPSALCFEPVTLLCLGRLNAEKGFDLALRAFAPLAARWPGSRLIVAGDGRERSGLEQLARESGLSGRVEFRGWIDVREVPSLMNEATLVLMPSRWEEPFGLVALEAAQMGRPVVATRVGGLPEVVLDGETGLLIPPEDIAVLGQAIDSLLRDPAAARRLGANGRERAKKRFTLQQCADAYHAWYEKLAGAAGGGKPPA